MTKVEELRELLKGKEEEPHEHSDAWAFIAKLFVLLEDKWQGPLPDVVTMHIYAIQSVAHASGVAEGAEQERKRLCVLESGLPDIEAIGRLLDDAFSERDPSVLAPTKESEK